MKDAWGGKREHREHREAGGPPPSVGCQGTGAGSATGAFGEQDKPVFKRPALEFLLFSLYFLMALLRHNSYDIKIPQIEMYNLVIF